MARYQVLNADNRVINIIEWDGNAPLGDLDVRPDDGTPIWTPVPQEVTPLQSRKALRQTGMMDAVKAFMASQPEEIQEEWDYATTVERTNHVIIAAAEGLGLTDEQVDDLFRLAATL